MRVQVERISLKGRWVMENEASRYQDKGLEKTPEVTPERTPEVTPENVGHLSGGEVNQLGIGGKSDAGK